MRPFIAPQRRVFLGCEGESEQGYAALLVRLTDVQPPRIYVDIQVVGGGNAAAVIEAATDRMRRRAASNGRYAAQAVLLDSDTRSQAPDRMARALVLAQKMKLHLIWQAPCHEALLLRHLPGHQTRRPHSTTLAEAKLQRVWPEYRKASSATELAHRIDRAAVFRAAAVEAGLRDFLNMIGFGTA